MLVPFEDTEIGIVFDNEAARFGPSDVQLTEVGGTPTLRGLGKYELEEAAGDLVMFFRQWGCWRPFTFQELDTFYHATGRNPKMMLFGLIGVWLDDALVVGGLKLSGPYVVHLPDGRLTVTSIFLERCLETVPA